MPGACFCRFFKQMSAVSHTGACGSAERNHRFAAEIVGFYKSVDRPRGNAPPYGITDEHGVIFAPIVNGTGAELRISFGNILMLAAYAAVFVSPFKIVAYVIFRCLAAVNKSGAITRLIFAVLSNWCSRYRRK